MEENTSEFYTYLIFSKLPARSRYESYFTPLVYKQLDYFPIDSIPKNLNKCYTEENGYVKINLTTTYKKLEEDLIENFLRTHDIPTAGTLLISFISSDYLVGFDEQNIDKFYEDVNNYLESILPKRAASSLYFN